MRPDPPITRTSVHITFNPRHYDRYRRQALSCSGQTRREAGAQSQGSRFAARWPSRQFSGITGFATRGGPDMTRIAPPVDRMRWMALTASAVIVLGLASTVAHWQLSLPSPAQAA